RDDRRNRHAWKTGAASRGTTYDESLIRHIDAGGASEGQGVPGALAWGERAQEGAAEPGMTRFPRPFLDPESMRARFIAITDRGPCDPASLRTRRRATPGLPAGCACTRGSPRPRAVRPSPRAPPCAR